MTIWYFAQLTLAKMYWIKMINRVEITRKRINWHAQLVNKSLVHSASSNTSLKKYTTPKSAWKNKETSKKRSMAKWSSIGALNVSANWRKTEDAQWCTAPSATTGGAGSAASRRSTSFTRSSSVQTLPSSANFLTKWPSDWIPRCTGLSGFCWHWAWFRWCP